MTWNMVYLVRCYVIYIYQNNHRHYSWIFVKLFKIKIFKSNSRCIFLAGHFGHIYWLPLLDGWNSRGARVIHFAFLYYIFLNKIICNIKIFCLGSWGTCLNFLPHVKNLTYSFSRTMLEGNDSYMRFTDFPVDRPMPSTVFEIFVKLVEAQRVTLLANSKCRYNQHHENKK